MMLKIFSHRPQMEMMRKMKHHTHLVAALVYIQQLWRVDQVLHRAHRLLRMGLTKDERS